MSEPLTEEIEASGDFAAMIEQARDNIALEGEGGQIFVHRPIEMEHLEGDDCPCRPLIVEGNSLHKPEDLLAEVEWCDG
jgi:hypothetical protein